MKCKICEKESEICFSAEILFKYNINYFQCGNCGFVQTEDPFWLKEAYERPINFSDTGYLQRNLLYSDRLILLLYVLFGNNGKFLDYAGGYGVFVRLMRDIGFDFLWDDKYTENLFAGGYEWNRKSKFDAVTLFEVFEHFVDPMLEIENLLNITDTIIFSTDLYPEPLPEAKSWDYYGLNHGQHISLFSKTTLVFIGNKFNLNYYNLASVHILTKRKISKFEQTLIKMWRFNFNKLIKRLLKSKTLEDHELMKFIRKKKINY
jgi:hypothetical protein